MVDGELSLSQSESPCHVRVSNEFSRGRLGVMMFLQLSIRIVVVQNEETILLKSVLERVRK